MRPSMAQRFCCPPCQSPSLVSHLQEEPDAKKPMLPRGPSQGVAGPVWGQAQHGIASDPLCHASADRKLVKNVESNTQRWRSHEYGLFHRHRDLQAIVWNSTYSFGFDAKIRLFKSSDRHSSTVNYKNAHSWWTGRAGVEGLWVIRGMGWHNEMDIPRHLNESFQKRRTNRFDILIMPHL